ncbi:MAG: hypothetical protein IKE58_10115 [Blautia sp.]|nr:hypothetical protein [Blautia sp.]
MDILEAYNKAETRRRKREISDSFMLAQLVAAYCLNDKDHKLPMPWDYYPSLFVEEKKTASEAELRSQIEEYKQKRFDYYRIHNERRARQI